MEKADGAEDTEECNKWSIWKMGRVM